MISVAVEKEGWVRVYNENNSEIFSISINQRDGDRLNGYTGSTVSVKKGGWIRVYNESGSEISSYSV